MKIVLAALICTALVACAPTKSNNLPASKPADANHPAAN